MTCPYVDEVVARFLDGDVSDGGDGGDGGSLAAHVGECSLCRRALAQSRHLDAAIAATVEIELRDPDALVAAAVAASHPVAGQPATPIAGRERRRLWPLLLTAAASFAIGLGVAWRRTAPSEAAPRDTQQQDLRGREASTQASAAAPAPAADLPHDATGLFTIPDQVRTLDSWTTESRGLDAARRAELILGSADLPAAVQMLAMARARTLGLPPVADARCEVAARVEAARALLGSRSRASTVALARALARDDATAAELQRMLADDREFKLRLRRELHERCEREFALAAATLADPELDRAAIARCRRDEPLADAIAAGVRSVVRPAAGVDFLLELWSTLARGGADGSGPRRDDADRANTWFAGLGSDAAARVVTRLRTGRSGELRGQCILALGAIADPTTVEPLLALVDRPNLHEAQLASYALGMLPPAVIPRVRMALAGSRRAALLWTALASLGDRAARDFVTRTGIPFEPTMRLRPEQIAAIAHALRGRDSAPPTGSRP